MKRTWTLLLAAVLALSLLAGCGGGEEKAPVYAPGSWDGNVYTSDFLKMQLTLPEGWTHSTAEELLAQAEADGNPPTEKQKAGDYSDALSIYELTASGPEMEPYMTMVIMNLAKDPTSKLLTADIMFQGIADGLDQQFGEGVVAYSEAFDHTIGGKTFTVQEAYFAEGIMLQWNALCFEGDYLYMISLVTAGENDPAAYLANFSPLS